MENEQAITAKVMKRSGYYYSPAARANRKKRREELKGLQWRTLGMEFEQPPSEAVIDEYARRSMIEEPPLGDPRPGYSALFDAPDSPYTPIAPGVVSRRTATLVGRGYNDAGYVKVSLPRITILEHPE